MTQKGIIWYWNDQANVSNDPTYTPNTIYVQVEVHFHFYLLQKIRRNCPVSRGTAQVKLCLILDMGSIVGIFLNPGIFAQ